MATMSLPRGQKPPTNASFSIDPIPSNCSVSPTEMKHRQQNGLRTFTEIIQRSKSDRTLLLKPANWCIIIEFIYQQIPHNSHQDKIKVLDNLRKIASNSVQQQDDGHRIIHSVHPTPGISEFLKALGFKQHILEGKLVMIEADVVIINTAITTLNTKTQLIKRYEELCESWQFCMKLLIYNHKYKNQKILTQLIPMDFLLNYNEYYHILQKFMIQNRNIQSIHAFTQQIMDNIGFNTSEMVQDASTDAISVRMHQIYDKFKDIEQLKRSIRMNDYYRNGYDDMKTEQISEQFGLTIQDIEWRKTAGIEHFREILCASEMVKYTHLMNPINWDILIDAICLNMNTGVDRMKQLQFFINVIQSTLYNEQRRQMKLINSFAEKRILNINGAIQFLNGIGYIQRGDRLQWINNTVIPEIALHASMYKMRIECKLNNLEFKWRESVRVMIEIGNKDPTALTLDIFSTLQSIDLYNTHNYYYEMLDRVIAINNKISDDNKKHIAMEFLTLLGLNLSLTVNISDVKLIQCLNSIYNQIKRIEDDKKMRTQQINDLEPIMRRLTVLSVEERNMPSLERVITPQNIMQNILQFGKYYEDQKDDGNELISDKELMELYDCDDIDNLDDGLNDKVYEMQATTFQMEEYLQYLQHFKATRNHMKVATCLDTYCKWNKKVELYSLNQRQIVHVMFYHTKDYDAIAKSERRANRFNHRLRDTRYIYTRRKPNYKEMQHQKTSIISATTTEDMDLIKGVITDDGTEKKTQDLEPGAQCPYNDTKCQQLRNILNNCIIFESSEKHELNMDNIDHSLEFHGDYRKKCMFGNHCKFESKLEENINNKALQLHAHFYHNITIDSDEGYVHSDIDKKTVENEERIQYKFGMDSMDDEDIAFKVLEFGKPFTVMKKSAAKFKNPKEEMLKNSYKQIKKFEWNDLLRRCVPFARSRNARKAGLSIKEIVSLKVYTDFDKLQSEFRMCFRDNHTKKRDKRQKEFYYWNKLLELSCKKSKDAILEKLYHGVNDSKLNAACFSGTYYGPVSTTTDVNVARTFAGSNGQIFELYPSFGAKGLSVSWLSNFPDENEILYMNVSFQISDIKKISGNSDFPHDPFNKTSENMMEQFIFNALRAININSKIISLNDSDEDQDCDNDVSNFKILKDYEKLCVLYLLYLQYRPKEWEELVSNSHQEYLSNAFMAFRDQFISLAQNVEAVSMDNMSRLLQIFFYTKSTEYVLPLLNDDTDLNAIIQDLRKQYIANQPFYFSIIVKLFPSAQQIALNGSNFDWSLKRFIDFLEVYDFDFHKIKLNDIYLRHIDVRNAKKQLIHSNSRDNIYHLRKLGWAFITPIHLRRVGLEPFPELPFLLTFINHHPNIETRERWFRTHSAKIMLPQNITPGNSVQQSQSLWSVDEDEEVDDRELEEGNGNDYDYVDHNPQNCTLSQQIFGKLKYKKDLIQVLQWRKRYWNIKLNHKVNIGPGIAINITDDQRKYIFANECEKVESLVLDPLPLELLEIFYNNPASPKNTNKTRIMISFEDVIHIFPNVTDVFLRRTTFKLRECYKFITFINGFKEEDSLKLERIFFSKTNCIREYDVNKVKLRLKEIGWNFVKAQQMICKNNMIN